ncbi:MAG: tetratricopeptide repeat protein [Kofleriaceae bacterium]|nr:tetratricopeptide repeat protein [Kofleriaceae bacterium]
MIERAEQLRRSGKADDAVAVLAQAMADGDTSPAVHAYLALALLDAGHTKAAIATLIGALLDAAPMDGHEEELGEIQRRLLENSQA